MSTSDWVLSVGAGLTAPFLIVFLIGCCLPRKITVKRSIRLKQQPRTVWETITMFERTPAWWPAVVMVERLEDRDGHPVYRQTFWDGRRQTAMLLEVVEAIDASRLVTRVIDSRGPYQGRWIYEIVTADGGCQLTVTEEGEIANPFVRTMHRLTMNKTQFVDHYLVFLGRKFGEQAAIA